MRDTGQELQIRDYLGRSGTLGTYVTRGYWQVPIAQQSCTKTVFTTPFGLFHFVVMPFGLHGAPSTFQRVTGVFLSGDGEYSAAYLDDLVVFSNSWPEHLEHLRAVLQRLREAGLTVKPTKCQITMNLVCVSGT